MENCFFRAFEGETNNPNLPYYNRIRVEFYPSQTVTGHLHIKGAVEVCEVENATVDSLTLLDDVNNNFVLTAVNSSKPIIVWVPKYSLYTCHLLSAVKSININDFAFSSILRKFSIYGQPGVKNSEIIGDLSAFKGKQLALFTIKQAGVITGDIKDISSSININNTTIDLVTCLKLTGTIESLIEGLMSSEEGHDPMTSGTFTINVKYIPGITLNGSNSIPLNYNISVSISNGVATLTANGNTVATYTKSTDTWTYA